MNNSENFNSTHNAKMLLTPDIQGFCNFLISGHLGSICITSTQEEIVRCLGKPIFSQSEYHELNGRDVLSMDYGNLLFTFVNNRMSIIAIYLRDIDDPRREIGLPSTLGFGWYPAIEKFNKQDFLCFLEDIGILFTIKEQLEKYEEHLLLIKPSQIKVYFEAGGFKIHNIIITSDMPS